MDHSDWIISSLMESSIGLKRVNIYSYLCISGVKNTDYGDVTARKEFREKKQCKSFKWYLENIYPESNMPLDFFALGEVSLYNKSYYRSI